MPLTLTYDGTLSRVRIAVSGLPGLATAVRVERSTNGATWTTVRGGAALTPTAGAVGLDDYEFAADVANQYRVRAYLADGREVGPALNANPWFEVDAAGWVATGATIARSTAQSQEGAASLLITPDGVSVSGGASAAARAAVTAGTTYLASAWVRTTSTTTVGPAVDWYTATVGGAYITTGFVGPTATAGGSWVSMGAVLTAPATTAGAVIRARHQDTPTAGQTWWADGVQLNLVAASTTPILTWWADGVQLNLVAASTTPILTATITPTLGQVWIKSLARPFLNRPVRVRTWGDVTRPARGGTFDVIGRTYPVAVTDVRGSRRWTLDLYTYTAMQASDLDLLLASGDILLIHVPAAGINADVPGGYVTVGDTGQARISPHSAQRLWSLPCTEVATPGPDVIGATSNWQTVISTYATWADVLAAHPTWDDLLELVGSPTDVIVP